MLDMLMKRRSIRLYQEKKVEEEKIQQLIKAALLSPSAKNIQPWEFLVVKDEGLLEQLSKSKNAGSSFLKNAPLGIMVIGDSSMTDVWIEDTAIASTVILLTAEAMGLGACWVQIRERKHNDEVTAEEYIKKLLNLPENKRVEAIISIGYPAEEKAPHKDEDLKYDRVYFDKYPELE